MLHAPAVAREDRAALPPDNDNTTIMIKLNQLEKLEAAKAA